jgi:hypothetical protein
LNPRFTPPLIAIGAGAHLLGILRGHIEILSAKSTQLADDRRQASGNARGVASSNLSNGKGGKANNRPTDDNGQSDLTFHLGLHIALHRTILEPNPAVHMCQR